MTNFTVKACPSCVQGAAETKDSRSERQGDIWVVRRRKRCKSCGHRWNTYEVHGDLFDAADLPELAGELNA